MAQVLSTIAELETVLADIVADLTGLESNKVLIQHEQSGQPSAKINENVAYVKVTPEVDERSLYKNRQKVYNEQDETFTVYQQSSRTLTLQVVFYGPDCVDYCSLFNEKLYFSSTKLLLQQQKLFIVPDRTNGPIRLPELHNGLWWERCDIEVRFYNTVAIEEIVNIFKEIDIRTEEN